MPAQPTILVKKKDGTSVRMTMEEFKAYQNRPKDVTNGPPVGGPANNTNTTTKTQDTRNKQIPNNNQTQKLKVWTKDDHKSPLEIGEVKDARKQGVVKAMLPEGRGDAYDAVIKNLKFPVADELRPRLKSLIVSRVKDIRTDEQVIEYSTRAVANGGLGLTDAQAGELVIAIKPTNVATNNNTNTPKTQDTKNKQITNSKLQIPNEKLQVTSYKLQEHRPIMHDVIAPKEEAKASVGPIEELQQVTLTDFRRLSSNPTQAGEILLGKFDGLKEESYLLFLKAVQSWYNSPLYKQYQQIIADAINKTVKIKDALGQMKEEEYKAIVKLCNSL